MRAVVFALVCMTTIASAEPLRVARATARNRARFMAGDDPAAAAPSWQRGDDAFALFPVGVDASWEQVIADDARLRALGVTVHDGEAIGLVFVEVAGSWRSGYSCALCHSRAIGGRLRTGPANSALRYGELLAAVFPGHPEATHWRSWGPGLADVTDDGVDDPLRIPDLVGLDSATYLQASGAHRDLHGRLAELLARSPVGASVQPVVAATLERWLRALPAPSPPDARLPGAATFAAHCAGCHDGPALGGRKAIDAALAGTDPTAAHDGLRGTGRYRVPPLLGVGSRTRLFHDGSVTAIADVLDPKRATGGHPWGRTLPAPDRAALVAYLSSSRFLR